MWPEAHKSITDNTNEFLLILHPLCNLTVPSGMCTLYTLRWIKENKFIQQNPKDGNCIHLPGIWGQKGSWGVTSLQEARRRRRGRNDLRVYRLGEWIEKCLFLWLCYLYCHSPDPPHSETGGIITLESSSDRFNFCTNPSTISHTMKLVEWSLGNQWCIPNRYSCNSSSRQEY